MPSFLIWDWTQYIQRFRSIIIGGTTLSWSRFCSIQWDEKAAKTDLCFPEYQQVYGDENHDTVTHHLIFRKRNLYFSLIHLKNVTQITDKRCDILTQAHIITHTDNTLLLLSHTSEMLMHYDTVLNNSTVLYISFYFSRATVLFTAIKKMLLKWSLTTTVNITYSVHSLYKERIH